MKDALNENYFEVMYLQDKIEKINKLFLPLKIMAVEFVFLLLFCLLGTTELERAGGSQFAGFVISFLGVIIVFLVHSNYLKKKNGYEWELYRLEFNELERKKKVAEFMKAALPTTITNRKINEPTQEVALPIAYYSVLLILDAVLGIAVLY